MLCEILSHHQHEVGVYLDGQEIEEVSEKIWVIIDKKWEAPVKFYNVKTTVCKWQNSQESHFAKWAVLDSIKNIIKYIVRV